MPAPVRVVAGPARSGKTAALLVRYRRLLATEPIGSALWLAPTKSAAGEIRERLLDDSLAGCFRPGVFTFQQFADLLLNQSGPSLRFVGQLLKRQVLQRVVVELDRAGQLQYFAPIANKAGLVDLLAGLMSDLKRQEVWPDEFRQSVELLGPSEKNREIAAVYDQYQQLLSDHRLYDSEGRFWSARALLDQQTADRWGQFAMLRHVVVDGFTDFTGTQHEILRLLATKMPPAGELTISLLAESETDRDELFLKSHQTLNELQARHPKLQLDWQPRSETVDWPALSHLERQLFGHPRKTSAAASAAGVEIIATAGQKAEIELVARQIKELLVLGDAESGHPHIRPEQIVVVFRSVEPVAALVAEVFSEYGIPTAVESAVPLGRSPVLQALAALVRLEAGDWQFRQLLAVLNNNYFQPTWPEWQDSQAAASADWAIRQVQVPRNREKLFAALSRAIKIDRTRRATADGDPDDEDDLRRQREEQHRYDVALALLRRLGNALSTLQKQRTLSDWIGILQGVVDQFGLLPTAADELPQSDEVSLAHLDQQAWELLKDALAAEVQLDTWLGSEPETLDVNQLLDRVQEILSLEKLPHDHDDVGRVRVLSAQSIRALRVPYLFVAGMSEKAFPPAVHDDRIYSEAECRRLNAAGLRFIDGRQRRAEEMLLFYEVVTRPERRLVLTYPALDEAAQPLLPSPYLLELQRALGGEIRRDISLSPVPQHAHPCSSTERRVKAMAEMLAGQPQQMARLIGDGRMGLNGEPPHPSPLPGGEGENMIASLKAIAARSKRDDFSPWEGLLVGESAQRELAKHYGPEHCWSDSRLEKYASCPYQFFAENVLGLRELPELTLETDFGQRGIRAHEVLAQLHRRLNQASGPRSPTEAVGEFRQFTDETLAVVFENIPEHSALYAALQNVDFQLVAQWLSEYLVQHEQIRRVISQSGNPAGAFRDFVWFETAPGRKTRTAVDDRAIRIIVQRRNRAALRAHRSDRYRAGRRSGRIQRCRLQNRQQKTIEAAGP